MYVNKLVVRGDLGFLSLFFFLSLSKRAGIFSSICIILKEHSTDGQGSFPHRDKILGRLKNTGSLESPASFLP